MRSAYCVVGALIFAAGGAAIWFSSAGTFATPESAVTMKQDGARPQVSSLPVPAPRSKPVDSGDARPTESGETARLTAEERAIARRWQEKAAGFLYGDLEVDLGITSQQGESIRALAIEHFARESQHDGEVTQEMLEEERRSHREFRDAVAAILDPEANGRFDEYQRSLDARAQVEWIRVMLEEARLPLSEAQRRGFIRESIRNGAFVDYGELPIAPFVATAHMHDLTVRSEQRDALLLHSAGGILDDRQLAKLEAFFQERHAAFRNSIYVGN